MSERDLDAEFERIIAGWDDEAPDPQPRDRLDSAVVVEPSEPTDTAGPGDGTAAIPDAGPDASPDASRDAGRDAGPDSSPDAGPDVSPEGGSGSSGLLELPIAPTTSHAWRGSTPKHDDTDEVLRATDPDDDHFVPPSEVDLPSAETDPMFWAIVGGLVGGPLLLLYILFFDRDGSGWWVVTALAMVVVGFVLLVLRGGSERDPFDDGTRV